MGLGADGVASENFAIYTLIYAWKQYLQLLTDTKLLPTLLNILHESW